MVLLSASVEIHQNGRPSYLISVAKQMDLPLHVEHDKSMNRNEQSFAVFCEVCILKLILKP